MDRPKLVVGDAYYVMTHKFDWVGRLESVEGPYSFWLSECSCVFNSGRLHEFIRAGKAEGMEVEPVLNRGQLCLVLNAANVIPWPHPLFREAV